MQGIPLTLNVPPSRSPNQSRQFTRQKTPLDYPTPRRATAELASQNRGRAAGSVSARSIAVGSQHAWPTTRRHSAISAAPSVSKRPTKCYATTSSLATNSFIYSDCQDRTVLIPLNLGFHDPIVVSRQAALTNTRGAAQIQRQRRGFTQIVGETPGFRRAARRGSTAPHHPSGTVVSPGRVTAKTGLPRAHQPESDPRYRRADGLHTRLRTRSNHSP